jgi:pimeloyl-ACP methyl ester carboxylesterase
MPLGNEIVDFPCADGNSLVGILTQPPPDAPKRRALIILSHSGLVHKAGSHRGQHNLAEFFASRGYVVFRFDPAGMGDSDGLIPEHINQDLFGSIESGRFCDSYVAAFEFLGQRFPDHRWILSGVCGGAISSLLSGVESRYPIAAYALISCPVVLDGAHLDYSRREPTPFAVRGLKVYASKIFKPLAIWRFITFRTDYKTIWILAKAVILRKIDKLLGRKTSGSGDENTSGGARARIGLSKRFVKAAGEAMSRSKVLFIYGNNDGFLWEFTDLYATPYLSEPERADVMRVVAHANHMFQWPEWQQQAFQLIDDWLTTRVLAS